MPSVSFSVLRSSQFSLPAVRTASLTRNRAPLRDGFDRPSQALAADAEVTGIEIVNFGIYTADIASKQWNPGGVAHNVVENPKLAVRTVAVPAQVGVHFGIEYKVLGSPEGAKAVIHRITRYPMEGVRPPGSSAPLYVSERDVTKTIGATSYSDYSLDEEWEAVPGEWSIEIWSNGRKLAEQHFTLVKP